MSIWTEAELYEQIADWKQALKACSKGQTVEMAGRKLGMSDLPEIRKTLRFLEAEKVDLLQGSGPYLLPGRPKR